MRPDPLLLAIDTSAAHCAVALLQGQRLLEVQIEEMNRGQAERLFPLIEDVLRNADKNWQALDLLAVGVGPGNFTGIRVAVSAIRGLALSLDIPAIGVSTLEALAYGRDQPVLALADARRDQYYAQVFLSDEPHDPKIVARQDLAARFAGSVGACVGHDALAIANLLKVKEIYPAFCLPEAIGRVALERPSPGRSRPAPLYLKAADAAPSRDAPPVKLA